jgi:hypothetical protein
MSDVAAVLLFEQTKSRWGGSRRRRATSARNGSYVFRLTQSVPDTVPCISDVGGRWQRQERKQR